MTWIQDRNEGGKGGGALSNKGGRKGGKKKLGDRYQKRWGGREKVYEKAIDATYILCR